MTSAYKPSAQKKPVLTKEIELLSNHIDQQKIFYKELGFNIVSEGEKFFSISAGPSTLRFVQDDTVKNPFYHFAFNIPQNKIEEAHGLMSQKTKLTKRMNSEEIIYLPNFNAHSIFFEDPCRNIVEFIARHDLKNDQQQHFDIKDLINISEIGLVTDDVLAVSDELNTKLNVSAYNTPGENFSPIGAEDGLIIIVKKGRIWLMSENQEANIFPVKLKVSRAEHIEHEVRGIPFHISSDK